MDIDTDDDWVLNTPYPEPNKPNNLTLFKLLLDEQFEQRVNEEKK